MKKKLLFILAMALFPVFASAQLPKFGNVKAEEFDVVPETATDTAANVMYLYHDTYSSFTYTQQNQLLLEIEYRARVKVLKEAGKDCATVSIGYYYNPSVSSMGNEAVYGITAASYNLVNGKVEKTAMSDKYVFTEQVNDGYRQVKFTVPNVKVGTIIEYKYKLRKPCFWFVPTWYAQKGYPVKYAQLKIEVPEFFTFNHFCKGYTSMDIKKEDVNVNFYQLFAGAESVHGYKIEAKAQNVPAIKNEGFVANTDIYATRVEFELLSTQIPGVSYKSYAHSWNDVRKMLKDDVFAQYLGMKNPLADAMAGMDLSSMNKIDRAAAVFALLKNKVKWNEKYELGARHNPKTAVSEGKGSNAELNFVLMSMLKDAGVTCTPMLIKRRMYGPILTPTVDDFSTFIVAFVGDDGSLYFLDSSADYGYVNAIPVNLLGYGVLFENGIVENAEPVYNLYDIGGNVDIVDYQGIITAEGELQASKKVTRTGLSNMLFKDSYHSSDSVEYVRGIEKKDDIKLMSYILRNADGISASSRETYRFTKSLDATGDRIYVNPLCLPEEHSNGFSRETRLYPVEFPFPQSTTVSSRISIPEGYEVEELPQAKTISMPDGSIGATISVTVQDNTIFTKYASELMTTMVAPDAYAELRKFWTDLLEMNNLTVVLKKK